jgi:GTPase SAR1 family protein
VGSASVGKNILSLALQKNFPDVCVALAQRTAIESFEREDEIGIGQTLETEESPNQAPQEISKKKRGKREVGGLSFMFGSVPIELQFEVADIVLYEEVSGIMRMEAFESVRPAVVIVTFSLENFESFNAVTRDIVPIVKQSYNDLPILLVGCKSDLRDIKIHEYEEGREEGQEKQERYQKEISKYPSWMQGVDLCYAIGGKNYVECSAKTGIGLAAVAREAGALAIRHMVQLFSRTNWEDQSPAIQKHLIEQAAPDESFSEVHENVKCGICLVCPILGKCFKCRECTNFYLCRNCWKESEHRHLHVMKVWHKKRKRKAARHVQETSSFSEGFRHKRSFGARLSTSPTTTKRIRTEEEEDTGAQQQSQQSESGEEEVKQDEDASETKGEDENTEQEQVVSKGEESWKRTGLGQQWKDSVTDLFKMFSK